MPTKPKSLLRRARRRSISNSSRPRCAARAPMDDRGDDPEDYGRTGYLFNALTRAGLTFRDYGGLMSLSGYDGTHYNLNVPALAALSGNVDLELPRCGNQSDRRAARERVRARHAAIRTERQRCRTSLTCRWQPKTARTASRIPIVLWARSSALSPERHIGARRRYSSCPEGTVAGSTDHVHPLRTYALVVSPLARRDFVGETHLSVASVLKTEEEIFGLPPLTLDDLLASDMAGFFTDAPHPNPTKHNDRTYTIYASDRDWSQHPRAVCVPRC